MVRVDVHQVFKVLGLVIEANQVLIQIISNLDVVDCLVSYVEDLG